MNGTQNVRAEEFLKLYRRLEGLLEARYTGHKMSHSSVVREYLDDPDSLPCRTQLDLCREIRNLLSHNADEAGEPVVDPSERMVAVLRDIVDHVQRPRLAVDLGTPKEKIMFAHVNERVIDMIRRMQKHGYSHMPVTDGNRVMGVFSAAGFFAYLERNGFSKVQDDMRIANMKSEVAFECERSEKYVFLPANTTVIAVRETFQKRSERNSRVAAVFITQDGDSAGEILAMLTPWDVMRDDAVDRQ